MKIIQILLFSSLVLSLKKLKKNNNLIQKEDLNDDHFKREPEIDRMFPPANNLAESKVVIKQQQVMNEKPVNKAPVVQDKKTITTTVNAKTSIVSAKSTSLLISLKKPVSKPTPTPTPSSAAKKATTSKKSVATSSKKPTTLANNKSTTIKKTTATITIKKTTSRTSTVKKPTSPPKVDLKQAKERNEHELPFKLGEAEGILSKGSIACNGQDSSNSYHHVVITATLSISILILFFLSF